MKKTIFCICLGLVIFFVGFVSFAGAATYYIDFLSGNDSNNGTSISTPWKHSPGMNGASGICASKAPSPGDRFIFKGGVTWNYTCFQWQVSSSGSSGNEIYYGVNQAWYSGGSWSRPIFYADY